ncbi:MAG: DNA repair protein RecO [Burkholderiaceae bacterium]|nr:DNA repair protein RecO [Burkholderiaceae bacterium]
MVPSARPLSSAACLAAFYLNELLVRLLPRNDAHAPLFASYVQTLRELEREGGSRASVLRSFELDVLREMGYAPALDHCAAGRPIDAAGWYRVDAQQGLFAVSGPLDELCLRGSSIIALARRDLSQPQAAADSKVLLRQLIRYHLNGQPLNTRRILQDLRRLELELP